MIRKATYSFVEFVSQQKKLSLILVLACALIIGQTGFIGASDNKSDVKVNGEDVNLIDTKKDQFLSFESSKLIYGDITESKLGNQTSSNEESEDISKDESSGKTQTKQEVSIEIKNNGEVEGTSSSIKVNGEKLPEVKNGRTQRIELEDGSKVRLRIRNDSDNNNDSSNSVNISVKSETTQEGGN